MRVTILGMNYQPEETGIAPYTSALAEDLVARGHDVSVLTTHPHYPEWKPRAGHSGWTTDDMVNGVRVKRLRHYIPSKPQGLRRLFSEVTFGIRLVCARWDAPEVVILVSPALFSSAFAIGRAKWGLGRPAVGLWVQDIYTLGITETGSSGRIVASVIRSVEAWGLRQADGVVVIHERFRKHVERISGLHAGKTIVIRNWTHLDSPTDIDIAGARARFGWKDNELIVLHAGAQGVKQDLVNVVEAARLADQHNLNVRFVLMGDGGQRSFLEESAAGVRRVEFVAPLPRREFQEALQSADVLLVNEKQGLNEMAVPSKLTSYFNSGRPVVAATDEGSVTADEIAASGGGLRVDANNPQALIDAVLRIGGEPGLGAAFANSGHEFREAYLTPEAALLAFDKWLTDLI